MDLPDYRIGRGRGNLWQRFKYLRKRAQDPIIREEIQQIDELDSALALDTPAEEQSPNDSDLLANITNQPQENPLKARSEEKLKQAGRWTITRPVWQLISIIAGLYILLRKKK
jgi:hypothetical protein